MGKESKEEWIYVYVKLIHFAVHLKLTQHCKSTILQYKIKIKKKNNLKIKLPYDPAIPLLGIFLKETKTLT